MLVMVVVGKINILLCARLSELYRERGVIDVIRICLGKSGKVRKVRVGVLGKVCNFRITRPGLGVEINGGATCCYAWILEKYDSRPLLSIK